MCSDDINLERVVVYIQKSWKSNWKLQFFRMVQIFPIVRSSPLQIAPRMLNCSQVWALPWLLQSLNLLLLVWNDPFLSCCCSLAALKGWSCSWSAAIWPDVRKVTWYLGSAYNSLCFDPCSGCSCRWSFVCGRALNIPVKKCQPWSEQNTLFPNVVLQNLAELQGLILIACWKENGI